ncbi:MAG: substrate-binding domain-containing protein [Mycoplasmoidaceae bacterium]
MKKIKIILYTLLVSSFAGIIIFFSIPLNLPTINMAGSSGVSPLAVLLANSYNDADIVVQAGGSGLGIDVALNGKKDIGMASKNPGILGTDKPDAQKWIDRQMKTITIAWDGMGIVYKPDASFPKEFVLNVDEKTLPHIYWAFAGDAPVEWEKMGIVGSKTKITPYARDGGATKSGTADAFFKNSNIPWDKGDALTKEQISRTKAALDKGDYGRGTIKTAEANSQAWDFFKSENVPGSMVYLSAGFILENKKGIEDAGFQIATYGSEKIVLATERITKGYDWYRALNLMVSLVGLPDYIKNFITWILSTDDNSQSGDPQEIIEGGGYILLTPEQKLSMEKNGKFWETDDFELGYSGAK